MAPLFGRVAAAQAAGIISADHARVVVAAVDKLPAALQAEYEDVVETELVTRAHDFDPSVLQRVATRLLDVLDADGTLTDDADHERRREFALVKHRDGSATAVTYLGPELTAIIDAYLDTHAAPRPAEDGTRDLRTPGQRNYDAIKAGFTHLMTCGPSTPAGTPDHPAATLILTMTAAQFSSGLGYATTAHGDLISVASALDLVTDGQTLSVQFDPHGGVMSYGHTRRLVPPAMRLAITARDHGCTFPGCDRPPAWSEAHHLIAFADGGTTSVDNCALLCGYHHRNFNQRGWQGSIISGTVHWTPPRWLDRGQTPRRNTVHDPPRRM